MTLAEAQTLVAPMRARAGEDEYLTAFLAELDAATQRAHARERRRR